MRPGNKRFECRPPCTNLGIESDQGPSHYLGAVLPVRLRNVLENIVRV